MKMEVAFRLSSSFLLSVCGEICACVTGKDASSWCTDRETERERERKRERQRERERERETHTHPQTEQMSSSLMSFALAAAESGWVPDWIIRIGIRRLLAERRVEVACGGTKAECKAKVAKFVAECDKEPVAVETDKANDQHYELPAEFFLRCLGQRLKYSSCFYETPSSTTLDEAEVAALKATCERAELADASQSILELGCGWGSLSLWMAEQYPTNKITAVSNSSSQREFIMERARERKLTNLTVVTANAVDYAAPEAAFDRVVSVEMFEHMRNHRELLRRISTWLKPKGKLFVHVFCHRDTPYLFLSNGPQDWMSTHFFSGGMMPSEDLLPQYQEHLTLQQQWQWNGTHYSRTLEDWLRRCDAARSELMPVLAATYGADHAQQWLQRWRMFFMACSELFAASGGNEWFVAHFLFVKP